MINPEVFLGRTLRFVTLDALVGVERVTTLGWRFIDVGDSWTQRFDEFKRDSGTPKAAAAINQLLGGVGEFRRVRIKSEGSRAVVMSLLPHDKDSLQKNDKLWVLGEAVATALKIEWLPSALSQAPHKKLADINYATQRDAAIKGVYSCEMVENLSCVVFVDDFVTRGSTMTDAARAIRETNPGVAEIVGFALAKNERQSYAASQGHQIDNSHIPVSIANAWDSPGS